MISGTLMNSGQKVQPWLMTSILQTHGQGVGQWLRYKPKKEPNSSCSTSKTRKGTFANHRLKETPRLDSKLREQWNMNNAAVMLRAVFILGVLKDNWTNGEDPATSVGEGEGHHFKTSAAIGSVENFTPGLGAEFNQITLTMGSTANEDTLRYSINRYI